MTYMYFTCRVVCCSARLFSKHLPANATRKYRFVSSYTAMSSINDITPNGNTAKRARGEAVIGTHSGTFHCDEVLACFMLRQLAEYKNSRILRSRDEAKLRKECDIIVDVGGVFDHERKWYDHHQRSFQETLNSLRPELGDEFKIKLSSAGLVYTFYGERILENILQVNRQITLSPENLRLIYVQIYRNFISEIDAIDNGVPMYENVGDPVYKISTNLSARVHKLNPSWEDERNSTVEEERFERAMQMVGQEFTANVLEMGASWIKAREYVRLALEQATSIYKTGEILLLERFCPWKSHLADLEKEYNVEGVPKMVLFSENEKTWRVAGVPLSPTSFLGRKFLPQPWRGLRDEELSNVADIPNLVFVHSTGFIGGATTKESALQMAIKSVQWEEEQ